MRNTDKFQGLGKSELNQIVIITISELLDISNTEFEHTFKQFPDPSILLAKPELLMEKPHWQNALLDNQLLDQAYDQVRQLNQLGLKLIWLGSPSYPISLSNIHDPPKVLYLRGVWPNQKLEAGLAIVGSRQANIAGCKFAEGISEELASGGACIISGLALGVDAAAHQGALNSGQPGATIAVMGNGLDRTYPATNQKLAEKILEAGGCLVSQFKPGTPPFPANFLNRNRIISGLSLGILVVQAASRSGTLATARYALEDGREVFAVPGFPGEKNSAGTNGLIKQGACLVTEASDIWDVLPQIKKLEIEQKSQARRDLSGISENAKLIFNSLKKANQVGQDDLRAYIPDSGDLAGAIIELEMLGIIQRLPGNALKISQ